jgi:signal transduction histidine kinase/Na+/proline symporter
MVGGYIFVALILYLVVLFAIAYKIDVSKKWRKRITGNPTVYALTLAVYCSAWTFFGSVGAASTYSIEFLTIYIGPLVAAPLLWIVYRKIIRISKAQGITSISDFISSRYNKSTALNRLVTVLLAIGIIPYIALQITGIERGLETCIAWGDQSQTNFSFFGFVDMAFVVTVGLGLFLIAFTTRQLQDKSQNKGLIGAIAFESIVKLIVFIVFGIYVCYYIFDSQSEVYALIPNGELKLNTDNNFSQWFGMILLSGLAFLFLPRQFEVGVFAANNEEQLKKAIWMFPIYLILINLFVVPIALAGNHFFADTDVNRDTYMLAIPLLHGHQWMALLVLLGGFSAASGMIIVATHAISKMVANSIFMPSFIDRPFILNQFKGKNHQIPVFFRRISILIVLLLAYFYYKLVAIEYSLISIGLVSFIAVSQFAPAILGGIFWKYGTVKGAFAGIISGFIIWFIFLVVPTLFGGDINKNYITLVTESIENNHGAIITTVFFWSMFINTSLYVFVSLISKQSNLERNQAELFVNIYNYSESVESSVIWKGKAFFPDVQSLLARFLGEQRANYELLSFTEKNKIQLDEKEELDPRVIYHAEKLLSNMIGSSSARILVASVTQEDQISMEDVVDILEESQKLMILNKELNQTSQELKRISGALKLTNQKLKKNDLLKDEFLYTVTHELRTPLTSIKALSELLADDDQMPEETKKEFVQTILKETNRMTRLISQVLDLENFEAGKHQLRISHADINELIAYCSNMMDEIFKKRNISLHIALDDTLPMMELDYDRITQVVINLLTNAVNHANTEKGEIWIGTRKQNNTVIVEVADNGVGVEEGMEQIIFEKFFQAENKGRKKSKGSGLGLAISKKIIQLHEGKIWVEKNEISGAKFIFTIPFEQNKYIVA